MKRFSFNFIYILIIIVSLTSCTDQNAKADETNKYLFEDYTEFILPVSELNDIMLESYNNDEIKYTDAELKSIEKHKGQKINVAIPTEDGFYDNIEGNDLGLNYFAALQLEKDLGLEFEYVFLPYDEILDKLKKDEIDIIVGKNSSDLYDLYNTQAPKFISYVSENYYSVGYDIYTKIPTSEEITAPSVMKASCGILLPQRESDTIAFQNASINMFPNVVQASTTEELLDMRLQYLILPKNSMVSQLGYRKLDFDSYGYNITSRYAYRYDIFDLDFVSAVDKTINATKELSLNNYNQSLQLIKCAKGYFFTPEEKAYIASKPLIRTKYLPSVYPISFYDKDKMVYNGKLVAILSRVSQITGLKFENVAEAQNVTKSDLLANLYNDDIDLAVGLENSFDKSTFIKYSNSFIEDDNIIMGYKDVIKDESDIYKYKVGFVDNASVDNYLSSKYPSNDFAQYETIGDAYIALKRHEIDFVATTKNNYYYILNSNNDYSLKNLFNLNYTSDSRYATTQDAEGIMLMDIINKVSNYVEADEIINANYSLSEIDTVGSYRSAIFLRIVVVIIFVLSGIGVYLFIQQKESKKKVKSIQMLNHRLDTAFKIASFAIITNKIGYNYFVVNDTAKDLIGLLDEDIYLENKEKVISFDTISTKYLEDEKSRSTFTTLMQLIYSIKDSHFREHTIQLAVKYKKDGERIKYFDVVVNVDEFNSDQVVLLFKDTTKETLYERYENVVNDTDTLTKARNRDAAYKLDVSYYNNYTFGYIDLDNFNLINTSFGHRRGDAILSELVSDVSKIKEVVSVYRMNGDEFLIILDEFDLAVADKIQKLFTKKILFSGHEVSLSASIGYYTVRTSINNSIEEVINIADYAKVQSKENGKNTYTVANEKVLDEFKQNNMIDASLKRAILDGNIIPFFQPYIDIETNKVVGYETLMRWQTEDSILSPFSFLSVAMKSGDIFDLDMLMFRYSAQFLKQLQNDGLADENFVASSNFTPLTLVKVNPFDLVKIVMEIGVDTSNITIEVTEQLFASDKAFEHIKLLKQYGFNIALDDFSVGHSSMAYLKRLSVDVLKIDKSLLDDTNNKTNLEIFKTVVNLGKSLNAKIISEGVETAEEVEVLFESKVRIGQGYYFSKPTDLETMYKYIENRNKR